MSLRPLAALFAAILFTSTAAASEEAPQRPGLWRRVLQTLHIVHREEAANTAVRVRKLTLEMQLSPEPLKLSETRQLKVSLALSNHSRKYVHLEFPTTQRIELLIRDANGKMVTQWSEDQAFTNQPAYVTVNPGERIQYDATLPTRELEAGRKYSVEGFFPNFEELKIQKALVPEK